MKDTDILDDLRRLKADLERLTIDRFEAAVLQRAVDKIERLRAEIKALGGQASE